MVSVRSIRLSVSSAFLMNETHEIVYGVKVVGSQLPLLYGDMELRLYIRHELHNPHGIDKTFAYERSIIVILKSILNIKQILGEVFANLFLKLHVDG
jgi:hypothetical protein